MKIGFDERVRRGLTKRSMASLGRKYEAEIVKDEKRGKMRMELYKREVPLPAKPAQDYTFEWEGLLVTVKLSDGQIINKKKAFKRFCEMAGGYEEAMRKQRETPLELRPQVTPLTEEGMIIETKP